METDHSRNLPDLSNINQTQLYNSSSPSVLSRIINENPDLFDKSEEKANASMLFHAILEDNKKFVEFLLSKGVNPNITNKIGETPLHHAADNSLLEIASLLIRYGANPNSVTIEGEIPLHNAAFRGDKYMVELLLSNNSEPNKKNNFLGRTPLHYAAEYNSIDCISLLLKYFADKCIRDNDGNLAYDLASEPEAKELLKLQSHHVKINSITETDFSSILKDSPCLFEPKLENELDSEAEGSISANKVYELLSRYDLQMYFEILEISGLHNLDVIFEKMQKSQINEEFLECIGIEKPGHRMRLLMAFEENTNGNIQDKELSQGEYVSMEEWLSRIKLACLIENFERAGYDDYRFLIKQMRSEHPLGHNELENIGIHKYGYRVRILGKLYEEIEQHNESFATECTKIICSSSCSVM
ncbi:unnamed protein product [Blepharisma stoltei]|uniref:SAM domain-containing protein n=1 Tax=Blepharisma stoltei TaxID=1481888 RepID=A0AAU9J1S8_9CILI|nr:unnamed protein product [Blepharisma stoltei]